MREGNKRRDPALQPDATALQASCNSAAEPWAIDRIGRSHQKGAGYESSTPTADATSGGALHRRCARRSVWYRSSRPHRLDESDSSQRLRPLRRNSPVAFDAEHCDAAKRLARTDRRPCGWRVRLGLSRRRSGGSARARVRTRWSGLGDPTSSDRRSRDVRGAPGEGAVTCSRPIECSVASARPISYVRRRDCGAPPTHRKPCGQEGDSRALLPS